MRFSLLALALGLAIAQPATAAVIVPGKYLGAGSTIYADVDVANTFSSSQTVSNDLSITGHITASSITLTAIASGTVQSKDTIYSDNFSKVTGRVSADPALTFEVGITSITNLSGDGDVRLNFRVPFVDTSSFYCLCTVQNDSPIICTAHGHTTISVDIHTYNLTPNLVDQAFGVTCWGAQ